MQVFTTKQFHVLHLYLFHPVLPNATFWKKIHQPSQENQHSRTVMSAAKEKKDV